MACLLANCSSFDLQSLLASPVVCVSTTHWHHSAVGLSGSKATAKPKRKNSSASKKAKKHNRNEKKASHANINDWSSDDSADAEPAPMQDQPSAMSDSDEANAEEAASADKHEVALAAKQKTKQQGEQQSAGRKRKKKSKGIETHSKRKSSSGTAKRHAHAKHARASDWTSDDSSDAQSEKIVDNLEPMSDSDADSQQGNRPSLRHTKASSLGKQGKKQMAERKSLAQPDSNSSPAERYPHRVLAAEAEEDWVQPAAISGDEAQPAQQTKRKGRLRKARASSGPTQHAAAGSDADDLMEDLEDDIPDVEVEAERHSISREAADKSEENLQQEESVSEGAGQQIVQTGKSVGAGRQDSETQAARCAGKRRDK